MIRSSAGSSRSMRFSGISCLPIVGVIGPSRRARVKAQGMAAAIAFEEGGVRGVLHRAEVPGGPGLVLTHGAGGNCRTPLLVAAAEAFVEAGVTVLRYALPFRQRRPTGPPSPSGAATDRGGLKE